MINPDRAAVDIKRRRIDELMATATKHYVRRQVWLPIAKERKDDVQRPIRYFTLTTPDLLDVRLFEREGLIERSGRGYPGLGFCERSDKRHSDIVRQLRSCLLAYKGTFEEMALQDDILEVDFDFDVVNLDFTWVPFPEKESPLEGTWGAIRKVLEVQWSNRTSFDLFLTFSGSKQGTDDHSVHQVADLLEENLAAGRGLTQFVSRVGHSDARRLLSEDYLTFLSLGLPKMFVGDALEIGFHLTRRQVLRYARVTTNRTYHILKFVFSLEIPSKGHRFASVPGAVEHYSNVIPQIFESEIVDIDNIVNSNLSLKTALENDLNGLKSTA